MANCVSVSSECVLILMWGFPLLFYFFFLFNEALRQFSSDFFLF